MFAVDSSCMIAAVSEWHEHHEATLEAIDERLARGDRLAVPAHALLESYSVLTRLPAPHRLSPRDAWNALEANFVSGAAVIGMPPPGYATLLSTLAGDAIGGGRAHDALIGAITSRARATELLTLNPKHFTPPPPGLSVVDPSDPG